MGAVRRLTACASQEPPTLREQDVSEDSERLPDGKDPDQPGIFLRAAMTADQPRVVVVGAGPVGLLAAGDLAAAGIDVTVIEKRAEGVSGPARPGPSQVPERQSDRERRVSRRARRHRLAQGYCCAGFGRSRDIH
jgi:hypothetical protein